jgi:hypothetical protein
MTDKLQALTSATLTLAENTFSCFAKVVHLLLHGE